MIATRTQHGAARIEPRGFTLVEMLVAVALVLLMMVLFAQVFQQCSNTMTRQKGMAENDQKARQLTLLLKGDIANRTFQDVTPIRRQIAPNYDPGQNRRGYFSISENDPSSKTDDVLAFTIQIPSSELPLSGRAALLKYSADTLNADGTIDLGATTTTTEHLTLDQYLVSNHDQPDFDDAQTSANNTSSSIAAEVCYFLRNGSLYRRMLLVRNSYDDSGSITTVGQPPMTNGKDYASALTVKGSGQFWRDFDSSAFHKGIKSTTMATNGMAFHTIASNSLSNKITGIDPDIQYPISLGIPHLRFGSTVYLNDGFTPNSIGFPREFLDTASPPAASTFIGRFNQQETAHSNFGYPGRNPATGNPMDPSTALTIDSATGLVTQYESETYRRGEDVMLSNVYEFDIKVWDDDTNVRDWVDLGHNRKSGATNVGYYNAANRLVSLYNDFRDNRYDTWHPQMGNTANPFPPYFPGTNGADGAPGTILLDDDASGTADDATERGIDGTDDVVYPLRAIQITIKYFDLSSNQVRQLTLVYSLI